MMEIASRRPHLFVYNGFTGDLARRFGIDGLYHAFKRLAAGLDSPPPLYFLATAGSNIPDLGQYLNKQAEEFKVPRDEIWPLFCSRWSFARGRCTDDGGAATQAEFIRSWLNEHPQGVWSSYMGIQLEDAMANNQNIEALRRAGTHMSDLLPQLQMLCLEKPAAKFEEDYAKLQALGAELGIADKIACVDHYPFKQGAEFMLERLRSGDVDTDRVMFTEQRIFETIGRGQRGAYPGPIIDTVPHAHAIHWMSRPWSDEQMSIRDLMSGAKAYATYLPGKKQEEEIKLRQLQVLNAGARYFYAMGDDVPTGYFIVFTPKLGRWAGKPAHWVFVKCHPKKLVECSYFMRPDESKGEIEKVLTYVVEKDVNGDGKSYGFREKTVRREKSGRRTAIKEQWTLPVDPEYGNGYRLVFRDVILGRFDRMLTLAAQSQGVCFAMALGTWLDRHYKGPEKGIHYIRGTDPVPLVGFDVNGHPRELLPCGHSDVNDPI